MPTFAELLTEYMIRTGIGDAELARRIEVSRLTLIRWKEGVTTRPRHREDVVRCAEVLRLTPDERDKLLLAAGIAPDNASVTPERVTAVDPAAPGPWLGDTSIALKCPAHLGSGVLGGETPVDGGCGLVALCLAGADVPLQGVFIAVS